MVIKNDFHLGGLKLIFNFKDFLAESIEKMKNSKDLFFEKEFVQYKQM